MLLVHFLKTRLKLYFQSGFHTVKNISLYLFASYEIKVLPKKNFSEQCVWRSSISRFCKIYSPFVKYNICTSFIQVLQMNSFNVVLQLSSNYSRNVTKYQTAFWTNLFSCMECKVGHFQHLLWINVVWCYWNYVFQFLGPFDVIFLVFDLSFYQLFTLSVIWGIIISNTEQAFFPQRTSEE